MPEPTNVIDFARVKISEIVVPPSGNAVPVEDQKGQRRIATSAKLDDQKSFSAKKHAWQDRIIKDRTISHLECRVALLIGTYLNRTSGDAWPSSSTSICRTRLPLIPL
jgi:hypothetical protein